MRLQTTGVNAAIGRVRFDVGLGLVGLTACVGNISTSGPPGSLLHGLNAFKARSLQDKPIIMWTNHVANGHSMSDVPPVIWGTAALPEEGTVSSTQAK